MGRARRSRRHRSCGFVRSADRSLASAANLIAFLAGYIAARYEGRAPDQCLRFAVACGAESTARLGAGLIDAREARRLMGDVELSVVDLPAEVT